MIGVATRIVPAILCALVIAPAVSAQEAAGAADRAHDLFEQGRAAADEGRLYDAASLFERSLSLYPSPAGALNLAIVRRAMGRPVAARDLAVSILRGSYGRVDPGLAERARELLARARAEVATIELDAHGATALVRIDGDPAGEVSPGDRRRIVVEPGQHLVHARGPSGQTIERSLDLLPGQERAVDLAFEPAAHAGSTLWDSPWTYVVAGAVALGVAFGIVLAVLIDSEPDAVEDPLWGQAHGLGP